MLAAECIGVHKTSPAHGRTDAADVNKMNGNEREKMMQRKGEREKESWEQVNCLRQGGRPMDTTALTAWVRKMNVFDASDQLTFDCWCQ